MFLKSTSTIPLRYWKTIQMTKFSSNMLLNKFAFALMEAKIPLFKSYCLWARSYELIRFMDVLFGVIHTRTVFESLQSVIVTHSNVLLTSPDTPAQDEHLRWTQLTISMWSSANQFTAWWAELQLPPTVLLLPLSVTMHTISLNWLTSWRVCYMYNNILRSNYLPVCQCVMNDFVIK